MSSHATLNHGPGLAQLQRRCAPLFPDRINLNDAAPSLFLYDLSKQEQLKCLDAIDLCCSEVAQQVVEIYLSDYDSFGQSLSDFKRGLALVKLPTTMSADALSWLTISLFTAARQSQLSIVPIVHGSESADEVLRCISPYCRALLREDSDIVDYANVISSFLRLRRTKTAGHFKCPSCDMRAIQTEHAIRPAQVASDHSARLNSFTGTRETIQTLSLPSFHASSF